MSKVGADLMIGPSSWVLPLLLPALALVAGLLAAIDAAAEGGRKIVSENSGQVCIWRGHTGSGAVFMFRPHLGCLSSSCTKPVEQSFTATVRQTPGKEIELTSRFVVSAVIGDAPCTDDCGGAGTASSTLTHLPGGTYRLTLGGEEIGQLNTEKLKGDPFNRICFGSNPEN